MLKQLMIRLLSLFSFGIPIRRKARGYFRSRVGAIELLEARSMLSAAGPIHVGVGTDVLSPGQPVTSSLTTAAAQQTTLTPTPAKSQASAGLVIVPTFDTSIVNDTNAATIEATINGVIAEYEAEFSDPITVNITFKEMTTGLGESNWSVVSLPYATYRQDLVTNASTGNDALALSHLPTTATDPVLGQTDINIKQANMQALDPSFVVTGSDGTVSLNTSICNLDRTTIDPTKYDLAAVTAHEIDEVLGLGSALDPQNGFTNILPEDLFRYDQNGLRTYTTDTNTQAYFSLDGSTHLEQFNESGPAGGSDNGDWFSGMSNPHVQDAFLTPGVSLDPSVEFIALDVIGYHYLGASSGLTLSNSTIVDQSPAGTTVGKFNTTEPGSGNTFTYTLVNGAGSTDNSSFSIDSSGDLITNRTANFATQSSYSILVRSTDQTGNVVTQQFKITVTPLHSVRSIVVNWLGDTDVAGRTTLRDAINLADSDAPGDTITFASSLFTNGPGTITLTQGVLPIEQSMAIQGPGSNLLTVSGANSSQIFSVNDGSSTTTSKVSISGMTLTQGAAAAGFSSGHGGAIYNAEQLTLTNDVLTKNSAAATGGAVQNDGTLISSGNTYSGNTAASLGGAIDNNAGSASTSNDTFTGNVSSGLGGAIAVFGGQVIATDDTIYGNTANVNVGAPYGGGGIANFSGTLTTVNVTITNNTSATTGGGVDNLGTWNSLNTIVAGNKLASNTPSDVANETGGVINASHTLIGDKSSAGGITATNGNIVGAATSAVFVTSKGVPVLGNNGGPTQTVLLNSTSPAVSAGSSIPFVATSSLTATSTSLVVLPGTYIAVGDSLQIGSEIVFVTAATGGTYTIARGQFGTTPAAHAANAPITLVFDQRRANFSISHMDMGSVSAALAAPVIISGPANQTVPVGSTATFRAFASGNPAPSVQWEKSTDGGTTYVPIPGATSSTYSFTVALTDNLAMFKVIFTNSQGSSTTGAGTLTVVATAPKIINNPASLSIAVDKIATFTASASGTPTPFVQWQVSTDGGASYTNIAGANSTTYSFTVAVADNGLKYRALFKNSQGAAVTTGATLSLLTAPAVTQNPQSQSVVIATTATFTAVASGNLTPAVQWQVSTNGGNKWSNLTIPTSNSTTLSFTVDYSQNNDQYRAVFTNAQGTATTKAAVLVAVPIAPRVTQDPADTIIHDGHIATFTAAGTGNPAPQVQWQVSSNNGQTYTNISGATSTTLSFKVNPTENGYRYRAYFYATDGFAISDGAQLTVLFAPIIVNNPTPQTVNVGSPVTFTASATGENPPNVQWQVSTDGGKTYAAVGGSGGNNAVIQSDGSTLSTYTFKPTGDEDADLYRAVFSNNYGTTATTGALLNVVSIPVIKLNPVSQSVAIGGTVTFTAASSNNPVSTVQWQLSIDGGTTYTPISGATTTTYTFPMTATLAAALAAAPNGSYMYEAVFTNSLGTATTTPAALSQLVPPTITSNITITNGSQPVTIGNPTPVPIGNTLTLSATAAGTSPKAQWQVNANGSGWVNIPGATSTTLNMDGTTTTTYSLSVTASINGNAYRALFSNSAGTTHTGAPVLEVVAQLPQIISPTTATTLNVVNGQSTTITATAQGGPAPGVQWQISTNGGNTWVNISGATNSTSSGGVTTATYTFTPSVSQNGDQIRASFSNFSGTANSGPITLNVQSVPAVTQQPASQTNSLGHSVTFTAQATASATTTVQWQVSIDGGNTWFTIVDGNPPAIITTFKNGTVTTSYTIPTVSSGQIGNQYRAIFTTPNVGSTKTKAATLS